MRKVFKQVRDWEKSMKLLTVDEINRISPTDKPMPWVFPNIVILSQFGKPTTLLAEAGPELNFFKAVAWWDTGLSLMRYAWRGKAKVARLPFENQALGLYNEEIRKRWKKRSV